MLEKRTGAGRLPVKTKVVREAVDYAVAPTANLSNSVGTALPKTLWRRRWVVLSCVVIALAIAFVMVQKATPLYSSDAELYVQQSGPRIINNDTGGGGGGGNYLFTQCELIKSSAILQAAVEKPGVAEAKCFKGVDNPVNLLKGAVAAAPGKMVDVITISTTVADPYDAALITNSIVQSYIEYQGERQRSTSAEVLKILQKEKTRHEAELARTSKAMLDFKRANPALAFETEQGNVVSVRLGTLSNALNQAQLATLQLVVVNEAADALANDPVKFRQFMLSEGARLASAAAFTEDVELDGNLRNTDRSIRQMTNGLGLGKQHPAVVSARAAAEEMKAEIDQERNSGSTTRERVEQFRGVLRQQLDSAKRQEEELRKAVEAERGTAVDLNVKNTEFQQLAQENRRTERVLDMLDSRMKEVNVTEEAGGLNISVLENAAANHSPVSPNKTKFLGQGLIGGLVIGMALAMLLEFLDQRLRSADEISEQLNLPILGTVPHIVGKQTALERGQEVHLRPRSDVAEAYRTVRTAVFFGLPDEADKTVLVTSPTPGDGKSTTASNIAIAMAQAGRRVLLIDADCRKPVQHKVFKIAATQGLSTVLLGSTTVLSAIQRTSLENIDFLPCGPLPPNPAELFDSQAFVDLLNEVALKYDNVVIDSPPVVPVTDARIIAASCDATVLVLRAEKSTRRVSVHAADVLAAVGANLIGVVVNDVTRGSNGYGYYSGYGQYRYGYGTTNAAGNGAGRVKEIEAVGAHEDEKPREP